MAEISSTDAAIVQLEAMSERYRRQISGGIPGFPFKASADDG
jgi:hypothetical protein